MIHAGRFAIPSPRLCLWISSRSLFRTHFRRIRLRCIATVIVPTSHNLRTISAERTLVYTRPYFRASRSPPIGFAAILWPHVLADAERKGRPKPSARQLEIRRASFYIAASLWPGQPYYRRGSESSGRDIDTARIPRAKQPRAAGY